MTQPTKIQKWMLAAENFTKFNIKIFRSKHKWPHFVCFGFSYVLMKINRCLETFSQCRLKFWTCRIVIDGINRTSSHLNYRFYVSLPDKFVTSSLTLFFTTLFLLKLLSVLKWNIFYQWLIKVRLRIIS